VTEMAATSCDTPE